MRLRSLALPVLLALGGGLLPLASPPASAAVDRLDGFSREAVRALWTGTVEPALAVPTEWTGAVQGCRAGAPSAAAARAGLDVLNAYRDLADVRRVTLDETTSRPAQEAALMMQAQGALSHNPDPGWACYSAAGSSGAGHSNLFLGPTTAAASVVGYIDDPGQSNTAAGHRRWLLDPEQVSVGLGQTARANAVYVIGDDRTPDPTGPAWSPWPSAGYLPVQAEPEGRWSLSAADPGTDFSRAGVQVVDQDGRVRGAEVRPVTDGFGSNTLVFDLGSVFPAGAPDRSYTVTVFGIRQSGRSINYTWTTRLFDAHRDEAQVAVPRPSTAVGGPPPAVPSPTASPAASPSSGPAATPTATTSPTSPSTLPAGRVHPLAPARLLDTRDGSGGIRGRLPDGLPLSFPVAGRGGVPSRGADAVLLNVTSTGTRAAGHLTVFPAAQAVPTASNLNTAAGATVANLVAVPLGADGSVSVLSNTGAPFVLADVVGWFGSATPADPGSGYVGLAPARVLDTRDGTGGISGRLAPHATVRLPVLGRGGVPSTGVDAVLLAVTATAPLRSGHLTVSPTDRSVPEVSTLNFPAGRTVSNLSVVPVGPDGDVALTTSDGTPHVLADVVGYLTSGSGGSFSPLRPARVLDTRSGLGGLSGRLVPRATSTFTVAGLGGVPASGARAVVLNVTAVQPRATGHLTVFPGGSAAPEASNLNHVAGQTVPVLVVVPLGPGGTVSLRSSDGSPYVLADVVGWFGAPAGG